MKIDGITLQLADGKRVEVEIKDARELYERLHELFGKTETLYVGGYCGCHRPTITWNSGFGTSTGAAYSTN